MCFGNSASYSVIPSEGGEKGAAGMGGTGSRYHPFLKKETAVHSS
jgi:hypothetical protein